MRKGINKLAMTLQERMGAMSEQPNLVDLGTIQDDYSLKTDLFPVPITVDEYLVCRSVTYDKGTALTQTKSGHGTHPHGPSGGHTQTSGDGVHSHPSTEGAHVHDVVLPDNMQRLQPGDRVLVCWIGPDPVVVDLVYQANIFIGG